MHLADRTGRVWLTTNGRMVGSGAAIWYVLGRAELPRLQTSFSWLCPSFIYLISEHPLIIAKCLKARIWRSLGLLQLNLLEVDGGVGHLD